MEYDAAMYGRPPLASSEALGWTGLRVERRQLGAMGLPAHHHAHHLLMLFQGTESVGVRRQLGNKAQEALFCPGDAGLYPGGEYGAIAWNGPSDTIHLSLEAPYLENLARQGLDLAYFGLRDRFGFDDPLLNQLGRQLLDAVGTQHALGRLYAESLATALCYHLIAHHATYERRLAPDHRLPAPVLARIDAYLEAHLEEAVTLETLAGLANLSVFHFARRFKQTTGVSPYQYVLAWKVRRAQQLLRAGGLPIAGIGEALGFASPTHFGVVFKRAVGMSPRAFQRG